MPRLIDADALIKEIDGQVNDVYTDNVWVQHMTAFVADQMRHLIDRQPTYNSSTPLVGLMYENIGFTDTEKKLFDKVEKALGFKLFRWQKTFIVMGAFRQYGETTAKILRDLLAVKETPLDLSTPKGAIEHINMHYYRDMQEKLTAAGIPTRTVFYSERQKAHYGKTISVAFIDDIHNRQQS